MAWPKTVPVLKASHIFKGKLNGPNDTHCLIGWCVDTFINSNREIVINDLRKVCRPYGGIVEFNDNKPPEQVAELWNRAMAKLDYVVGNPEAKC